MNIKTGDTVKVIAGKDKGAQGEVLFAFPEKGRVTVQGVNLVHKALRPTQANPNGGIDTREAAIDVSNVMLVCPNSDCLAKAVKNKGLERSFKQAIPKEVYEALEKEMEVLESE